MSVRFFIIATGYNCAPLVKKCIDSVRKQTYQNFEAIFISDGSTDTTGDEIKNNTLDRFYGEVHRANRGAAYRRFMAIKDYCGGSENEETVVLLLGLDDELLPKCLERVAKEYEQGKWMTYGNWIDQNGWMLPNNYLRFDRSTHRDRSYRLVRYRSTAPNTFKRFLFDQLSAGDFMLNGRWIDSTTESELMFSCLEMCGEPRIGMIKDPIYLYNRDLPGGTLKRLGIKYKYDIYAEVIKRPKRPLLQR